MNAGTIYGVFAKSRAGKERLNAGWREALPPTFPKADAGWWVEADAGLLLYRAHVTEDGCALVLAGEALVRDDGSQGPGGLARRLSRYGIDSLREERGEFALAFWDGQRRGLHLARDPFGQRTLFLRDDGDTVTFCSELPPLLDDPGFNCQVDFEAAQHFLCFGLPPPRRTLARGVGCVSAAHVLEWSPGRPPLSRRYYTPLSFDQRKVADAAWREHIAATLDAAIYARDGGGRGAVLLSGGVDSSYIATTCALRHGGEDYDAYTIEFIGGDVENEVVHARRVADAAGLRHHVVPMSVADARAALHPVLSLAQPCSAWAALTHHQLLTRVSADGHRRLLSGLGADEVFGGYSRYLHYYKRVRAHDGRWKTDGVDAFGGLLWHPTRARAYLFPGVPCFFDAASQRAALHKPYSSWSHAPLLTEFYRECREIKPDAHLFESMVAHECQHRVPDLLLAGFEPIARAAGVETLYPFLDPHVAQVACALGASERFWLSGGRWKNKKVMRRIALERLPEDIILRKPMSYNTPIRVWLEDAGFGGEVRERLRASAFWEQGLVRREWLQRIESGLRESQRRGAKPGLHLEQLWILIVLSAWVDRWVARRGRPG